MSVAIEPVRLTQTQIKPVTDMMGRAFVNDPFLKYLAPDDLKRTRLTPEFVGIVVKYCAAYGEVWTTADNRGAACWLSPGKTSPTFGGMLKTGMLTMPLKFGWSGFQRFMGAVNYTEALHKQFAPQNHWYLWGLGVDPAQQGQGIGSRLLQPVLAQADREGLPCYLETQNKTNLSFYHRHGFAVASDGTVPNRSLRVWALVRKPRAPGDTVVGNKQTTNPSTTHNHN